MKSKNTVLESKVWDIIFGLIADKPWSFLWFKDGDEENDITISYKKDTWKILDSSIKFWCFYRHNDQDASIKELIREIFLDSLEINKDRVEEIQTIFWQNMDRDIYVINKKLEELWINNNDLQKLNKSWKRILMSLFGTENQKNIIMQYYRKNNKYLLN